MGADRSVRPGRSPLVFIVRIADADPIRGTVAVEGEGVDRPFSGWIELMAQITVACRRHGHDG